MPAYKPYIKWMPPEVRAAFEARIMELRLAGFSTHEVAEKLAAEFPDWHITIWTVQDYYKAHRGAIDAVSGRAGGRPPEVEELVQEEAWRTRQRELVRELQQLQRTEAKRQQYIRMIEEALKPYEPTPLVPKEIPSDRPRPEHFWLLLLSDWHIGQSTPIQTTGGIYEQSTAVARWQLEEIMLALRSIHAVQSHGQDIKRILVVFNGDLIENDTLRAAQAAKIDRFVTQQAVEVFDLMGYVLRELLTLPGIEHIDAHTVGGNHDRTSRKAGSAGLGELDYCDSFAWVIGQMLQRAFVDEPRVTIHNWDTFFGFAEFAGSKIVFEHGSSFRYGSGSYGGVPWYPIVNAATRLVDMLGGGDLVLFGHVHRPGVLPIGQNGFLVVNGALPATSDYIQATYKAVRTPTQWLVVLHEEHGAIEFHPLYAPPASLKPPGYVWKQEHDQTVNVEF